MIQLSKWRFKRTGIDKKNCSLQDKTQDMMVLPTS